MASTGTLPPASSPSRAYKVPDIGGRIVEWRGRQFKAASGSLHPAYSLHTFDEEKDFKEEHWNVEEGDTVFDVGASYGAYTLPALCTGAVVHAFEPEPSVWADLMLNVELNGWNARCFATCGGLWDKVGEVDMKSYAPHWPQHTITGKYKMDTLDGVVKSRGVEAMNWLKIDVEGAEMQVLDGGVDAIALMRPKIIVEVHTFLDATLLPRCKALLEWHNYALIEVPRDPCIMLVGTPL